MDLNDVKTWTMEKLEEETRVPVNSQTESSRYNLAKAELEYRRNKDIYDHQRKVIQQQEDLIKDQKQLLEIQEKTYKVIDFWFSKIVKLLSKKSGIATTIIILILAPFFIQILGNIATDLIHKLFPWLVMASSH